MVFSQHTKPFAKLFAISAFLVSMLVSGLAHAEYALNFQEPVTEVARDIYGLHMAIFYVCVIIFVAVFSVMFYSIFKHRKSKNYEPSQFSHSTSVEIVWTIIPFFILVGMAIPATNVLIKMEDTTKSDITIKITGYQWKWGYEYFGTEKYTEESTENVSFYSTLATPRAQIDQFDESKAQEQGENYLLEVDNHLVVPSGKKIRALITANDVIHAWWIPAFGAKKDAIPGYINELWFNVEEGKEGLYRGQCAELCGKDHAFMPIVVEVITYEQYLNWLEDGAKPTSVASIEKDLKTLVNSVDDVDDATDAVVETFSVEAVEKSSSVREATKSVIEAIVPAAQAQETMSKEALMELGAKVYASCSACHGANGQGIPQVFPAIAGSPIVNGPVDAHIELIMFGKAGTAMAAFANQLSDEELAAVITYQRNSFGNTAGDVVLPADIKAKRN